jgi:hypothetical protein
MLIMETQVSKLTIQLLLRVPNLLGIHSLYTMFLAHTFSFTLWDIKFTYRGISICSVDK